MIFIKGKYYKIKTPKEDTIYIKYKGIDPRLPNLLHYWIGVRKNHDGEIIFSSNWVLRIGLKNIVSLITKKNFYKYIRYCILSKRSYVTRRSQARKMLQNNSNT